MPAHVTNLDPTDGPDWIIDDTVIRLREFATERSHELSYQDDAVATYMIGRAAGNAIQIHDSLGYISRCHAELMRDGGSWMIRDRGSKNGTWQDDVRRDVFQLAPGVEVGIGTLTLIAESPRSIALRGVLARLIGWESERRADVDRALRAVREMATLRRRLLVCGDGDLVPIARQLHRLALGDVRPFVVCDPTRKRATASVLSAANEPDARAAVAAASGGTLCIWSHRLPPGFGALAERLGEAGTRVRLVVCARGLDTATAIIALPLRLPGISERERDLTRIISEYVADAGTALDATPPGLTRRDLAMLLGLQSKRPRTLAEISRATFRLVAIRHFEGVTKAARYFGVSHVVLSRWLKAMKTSQEKGQ